jgi:hypothetical protein
MTIEKLEAEVRVQGEQIRTLEMQVLTLQRIQDLSIKLVYNQMEFAGNEAGRLRRVDANDVKKLREYVEQKESQDRHDLDLMVLRLREGIGKYQGGMDYKQVQKVFSLEAPMQAYRIMRKAHETYPEDFTLHKQEGYRNGKLILRQRKDV